MANPTTNYGFVLPTSSDLVTDLPADFEVALQGVDTQMKTNADAATQKATLTTKGDIYGATGASTPARLAVGANDTVLTADSTTATGLKWAAPSSGGITLLSTTTLTGVYTDVSSISGSYKDLVFVIHGVTNATGNGSFLISPNTSLTTNSNFLEATSNGTINGGAIYAGYNNSWLRTDSVNTTIITINNYAASTFYKPFTIVSNFMNPSSVRIAFQGSGVITSNTAISSMRFDQSGGDWSTGTVLTYGVK